MYLLKRLFDIELFHVRVVYISFSSQEAGVYMMDGGILVI